MIQVTCLSRPTPLPPPFPWRRRILFSPQPEPLGSGLILSIRIILPVRVPFVVPAISCLEDLQIQLPAILKINRRNSTTVSVGVIPLHLKLNPLSTNCSLRADPISIQNARHENLKIKSLPKTTQSPPQHSNTSFKVAFTYRSYHIPPWLFLVPGWLCFQLLRIKQ